MSSDEESLEDVYNFKAPGKVEIQKALGKLDDESSINFVFTEKFFEKFDSLPSPIKETDWLAQYAEKGQSYMEYLQLSKTLHTPASSHRKTIYLTLFGPVDSTIFDVDSLADYTQRFFQMQVKLINPFTHVQWNDTKNQWTCKFLPFKIFSLHLFLMEKLGTMTLTSGKSRNFDLRTRYNEKTKHSQIRVNGILNLLKKVVPEDARCLIALSMCDLYDGNEDLFIAGLAMGNNRVAAFSLYRYDPYLTFDDSNWFDCKLKVASNLQEDIDQRRDVLLLRACRLLTHEICHLFGIAHCIFYSCLLNGSGNLGKNA